MSNSEIELHDSTIELFSQDGSAITLKFSEAYVHKSEGKPGVDAGTGWWQPLEIRFEDATYFGSLPEFPEEINTGILTVNERVHHNMLPIDLDATGSIELYLLFWMNGKYEFTITAKRIIVSLSGDAEYAEEFSGTTSPSILL